MGCVIDHLQADYRVRVLRDFLDARGASHRVGETGVIRTIALDWGRREIAIEWERDGMTETLVFGLDSQTGPGNGRMREYFERGEYEPEPRPVPQRDASSAPAFRRQPDIASEDASSHPYLPPRDAFFEDGPIGCVVRLAVQGDVAKAERLLRLIEDDADSIADSLTAAAVRHAANRTACSWLRQQAENYWYYWGSQATSGGDGAARLLVMRPALARLKQLEEQP